MSVSIIDYQDPKAGTLFVDSLRETGFAVVENHPLDSVLLGRIYADWLAFFHSEVKWEFSFDGASEEGVQDGYVPANVSETAVGQDVPDLKEFYNISVGSFLPASLRKDISTYRRAAFALARELVGWIDANLPSNIADHLRPLSDILADETSLLRVLHYPPVQNASPKAVRAAAHEDINIITLLPVSEQPGLQVKGSDGEWVDLAGSPGALAINTGDMLQEATNFFFPSTTHRVVNPDGAANISRVSMPYFMHARREVVLSQRYTAGSYLAERLALINPDL
ncbi:MAG: 2OG-Fe(II) oxygenase family protein [Pseudomonadota bacterium]